VKTPCLYHPNRTNDGAAHWQIGSDSVSNHSQIKVDVGSVAPAAGNHEQRVINRGLRTGATYVGIGLLCTRIVSATVDMEVGSSLCGPRRMGVDCGQDRTS
jgi:hypothetical protein